MFDLEQKIAEWRRELACAGITETSFVDELESHLREEIERRVQSGEEIEQAFGAAVVGLGDAAVLAVEFGKLWPDRQRSKFLQIFYYGCTTFVLVVGIGTLWVYEAPPLQRMLGIAAILLMSVGLCGLPNVLRRASKAWFERLAKIFKLGCQFTLLWSMLAVFQALHILTLGMGIVPTMVCWCASATAVLCGLACVVVSRNPPSAGNGEFGNTLPVGPTPPFPSDSGEALPEGTLQAATAQACRLGHDYIGTEHLLLAVLQSAETRLDRLLRVLQLERQVIRREIERSVLPCPNAPMRASFRLTPRARKAIRIARKEAEGRNQARLGMEQVFLGLLLERTGVAGRVLRRLGVDFQRARKVVLSGLGISETS